MGADRCLEAQHAGLTQSLIGFIIPILLKKKKKEGEGKERKAH